MSTATEKEAFDSLLKVFKHEKFRSETQQDAVFKVIEGKSQFRVKDFVRYQYLKKYINAPISDMRILG